MGFTSSLEQNCGILTLLDVTLPAVTLTGMQVCIMGDGQADGHIKEKKRQNKGKSRGKKGYSPKMVCLFSAAERLNTLLWSPGSVL